MKTQSLVQHVSIWQTCIALCWYDNSLTCWLSGIFFDTYGEYYEDLREFHQHLPILLKPGGIYSFFNGLCGGNAFFHVVYCHLVSLELENLGYSTQLIPLPVKDCLGEEVWEGVKHKYWQLDTYYLPVCQSMQDSEWCLILFFKDNLRSASNKLQVSILLINEVLIYFKKKFQYSLMLVLSFYLWIWRVKILLKIIIMEFSTYWKYMASHYYWFEPTMAMKLETISSRMY